MNLIEYVKNSKTTAVVIVSSLMFIDFMLLTAIVPVVPIFLWKEHLRNTPSTKPDENNANGNATILLPLQSSTYMTRNNTSKPSLKTEEIAYLATQSVQISTVIAAKPAVQILSNFLIGPLIDRIGSSVPMFIGVIVIFATATAFALGQSYPVLLCSAAIQGIGSGCIMAGGMSLLAAKFTDLVERGRAIGMALGIIIVGAVVGPPYGSVMDTFAGKTTTFLVLAGIIAVIGVIQVWYNHLKIEKKPADNKTASIWALLKDPHVMLASSSIIIINLVFGAFNAGLTTWLIRDLNTPKYLVGVAFIPICVSYISTTNLMPLLPVKNLHWAFAVGGVFVTCLGCLTLPFATSLSTTIGPTLTVGLGTGILDMSIYLILPIIVENRHRQAYGSAYAIANMSVCMGLLIGPLITGFIVKELSFPWVMWILSIIYFIFAPSLIFLKHQEKPNEETVALLNDRQE